MQAYAASLACPVGAIRLKVPDPLMKKVLEIFPAEVSTQSNDLNFPFSFFDHFLTSNICHGIFIFIPTNIHPFHDGSDEIYFSSSKPVRSIVNLYAYFIFFIYFISIYFDFIFFLICSLCVVRFEAGTLFPFFKLFAERFIFFSTLYLLLRLIRRIFLE